MKNLCLFLFTTLLLMIACKKDRKQSLAMVETHPVVIKANSTESGGTILDDGNSNISQRGICWAEKSGPTTSDNITRDGTGDGSFISTLTELKGKTKYYIKAYAINATGTAYGNEVNFITTAGLPTVITTGITDSSSAGASVGGDITNDGGDAITERGIVYALTPNPTTGNFKIAAGTGAGVFSARTSTLGSQQQYYLRAYAINSYGTSYGNEIQFVSGEAPVVVDIDGNGYKYEVFCNKVFMTENLKTTRYQNGDPIVNGLTGFNWATGNVGAYTFPEGNVQNKESAGLYYNLSAVNDPRGVCPAGWHVATDEDWKALEICVGMTAEDADKTGPRSAYTYGLISKLNYTGYFYNVDSTFNKFGEEAIYWSSTAEGNSGNWIRRAPYDNGSYPLIWRTVASDSSLPIRCVRDIDYQE